MFSKIFLAAITGGITLLGVLLFTSQNFPEEKDVRYFHQEVPDTFSQSIEISKSPSPLPTRTKLPSSPLNPLPNSFPSASPVLNSPFPTGTPSSTFIPPVIASPTQTLIPTTAPKTAHIFYTSSHWKAKYYYCDTDDGWKKLSSTYLKSFNSEEELLKNYSRVPHEPCKD